MSELPTESIHLEDDDEFVDEENLLRSSEGDVALDGKIPDDYITIMDSDEETQMSEIIPSMSLEQILASEVSRLSEIIDKTKRDVRSRQRRTLASQSINFHIHLSDEAGYRLPRSSRRGKQNNEDDNIRAREAAYVLPQAIPRK